MFDQDPLKWNREIIEGYSVLPPEKIVESGVTKLIVCVTGHYDEIYASLKYLEKMGIEIVEYRSVL